jgi:rhamnulokinase
MRASQQKPFLAFDLGAESGRAVLGRLHSGVISIEEVYRFSNEPLKYGDSLHWDAPKLWLELRKTLSGLENVELNGIGVDTWGVDYALLGKMAGFCKIHFIIATPVQTA